MTLILRRNLAEKIGDYIKTVRLKLTYGAVVRANRVRHNTVKTTLRKLQRLVFQCITGGMVEESLQQWKSYRTARKNTIYYFRNPNFEF